MPKSQRTAYAALAWILDALSLVAAFFVAVWLREGLGNTLVAMSDVFGWHLRDMVRHPNQFPEFYRIVVSPNPLVNLRGYIWVLCLSIPTWLFFLNAQRAYDPQTQRGARQEFAVCGYAGLMGTMAVVMFSFLAKFDASRLLLTGFLIFGVTFVWLERRLLLPFLLRGSGKTVRNTLLIGDANSALNFLKMLESPAYSSSRLIGYICDEHPLEDGVTYLGGMEELAKILDRDVVDEVVIVRSQAEAVPPSFAGKTRPGHASPGQVWGDILQLSLERGRTVSVLDEIVRHAN
jgi:hypothetical protein